MVDGVRTVIDIKTGDPDRWHGVQLAAYALALDGDFRTLRRLGVYLRPDGAFRTVRYEEATDFNVFTNCYNLHRSQRAIDVWLGRR
jgi:hypothetical protein